ncbi:MAG: hypothetical protein JXR83_18010 [Deltaproteobacteria bacterium]|nr:hypothetical protein [Deltaproteobacteria bacterium]
MAVAGLVAGCLMTPVDPPIEEPELNHAPHIAIDSVSPVARQDGPIIVRCTDNELDTTFEVRRVLEYDTEQTLYVRWFVDYSDNWIDINSRPFAEQDLAGSAQGAVERRPEGVRVPANWLGVAPTRTATHMVEVDIADALPLTTSAPRPYRTWPEGALFDSFYWLVEMVDEGGCE